MAEIEVQSFSKEVRALQNKVGLIIRLGLNREGRVLIVISVRLTDEGQRTHQMIKHVVRR